MASVHSFNEALAKIRGVSRANIESYSLALRRAGLLPESKRGGGATPLTTVQAGYMLASVMRGSPVAAVKNAREVGDLIVRGTSGGFDQVTKRVLHALDWPADMSFAPAIGWLIDRHVDGSINSYIEGAYIKVEIDRYWTMASIRWEPTRHIIDEFAEGWFEGARERLQLTPSGKLPFPFEINFHTPLLHGKAHREYLELKKSREKFDVWGNESVTQRTLIAIAEVFK